MGYEELVDTEICAMRNDAELSIEDDNAMVRMTIDQATSTRLSQQSVTRQWMNEPAP